MKTIGLTGGIGSGKTTVAGVFQELGIPVFNSDKEAKKLYQQREVVQAVTKYFGNLILTDKAVDFKKVAKIVFSAPDKLKFLNELIHPLVHKLFMEWMSQQKGSWCLKESAILFESGGDKSCDVLITVEANEQSRVQRVMKRDNTTEKLVASRIARQLSNEERKDLATFVIMNNTELLVPQVIDIINSI